MSIRLWIAGAVVALLGCLALPMAATAQQQVVAPLPNAGPANAGPPANVAENGYVLGPDDVIEVEVLGRGDFRVRGRIAADGKMQLPFLGEVVAANKTAKQFGAEIAEALTRGGYYQNPVMRVEVVGFASRYAVVLGAVGSPGLVPINRSYRLSEIMARVGGVRGDATDYIILRSENGPERRIMVRDMAVGDETQDPVVSPGDKIYVPIAETFYISGQVRAPGTYPMTSDMTFRQAIAKGGGLNEMGSDKKLKVTRGGKELNRVQLDTKVLPGDIIVVGERLF